MVPLTNAIDRKKLPLRFLFLIPCCPVLGVNTAVASMLVLCNSASPLLPDKQGGVTLHLLGFASVVSGHGVELLGMIEKKLSIYEEHNTFLVAETLSMHSVVGRSPNLKPKDRLMIEKAETFWANNYLCQNDHAKVAILVPLMMLETKDFYSLHTDTAWSIKLIN
jgi:hypothetical protein